MDMMLIFDVIILLLGVYLVYITGKMKKDQRVNQILVPELDMMKCSDQGAYVDFLVPRVYIFAAVCIVFGVQGLLNDLAFDMGTIVNAGMIVIFVAAWVWFSVQLRKGKEKFCK